MDIDPVHSKCQQVKGQNIKLNKRIEALSLPRFVVGAMSRCLDHLLPSTDGGIGIKARRGREWLAGNGNRVTQ